MAEQEQDPPLPTAPEKKSRARSDETFPVVGIGASAGGLEALELFFAKAPPDSGS